MKKVEVNIGDFDDNSIASILKHYHNVKNSMDILKDEEEKLRVKVKIYLKEKGWDSYKDPETDISIAITTQQRETIDKNQLRMFLTASQVAEVTKISTIEKMTILTPEAKKRMNNFLRG